MKRETLSVGGNSDANDLKDGPLHADHTLQFIKWIIRLLARNRWCTQWGNLGKFKIGILTKARVGKESYRDDTEAAG